MVFRSFDIYRRPYSVILDPGEGLATTTLCEESFLQSLILHSVLLQCPHMLPRGSNFVQIQTYLWNISSFPLLYRCLAMTEKSVMCTTNSFFCWTEYSFSMVPIVIKWIVSSKCPSVTHTAKSYVSSNPSSKLVGSSPISICDKWSSPAFKRLGFTTTSKSYSWNNKSHLHMRPPNTCLLTKCFSMRWLVYILKCPPSK